MRALVQRAVSFAKQSTRLGTASTLRSLTGHVTPAPMGRVSQGSVHDLSTQLSVPNLTAHEIFRREFAVMPKKSVPPLLPRNPQFATVQPEDIAYFKSIVGEEGVLVNSDDIQVR